MYGFRKRKRLLKQKEALESRLYDCLQAKVENPEVVQAAMSDLQYNIVRIENELYILHAMKPFRFAIYAFVVSSLLMLAIGLLSFTYPEPNPIPQTYSKFEKRIIRNIMMNHLEPVTRIYKLKTGEIMIEFPSKLFELGTDGYITNVWILGDDDETWEWLDPED
jgi:hypothetical protein